MRIAVGGIGHETNTFSTLRTTLDDFHVSRGSDLLQGDPWNDFRSRGVWFSPALQASAGPHGLVERASYLALRDELLDRLAAALPVDGIHLDLHGAMEVEEIGDGEADLLASIRRLAGSDVPISASLDLHANLSGQTVGAATLMTALRTAPHRDGGPTRLRALSKLVRIIEKGLTPASALVKIPLLLAGESAVTEVEPARSLYRLVEEIEALPGILDASLLIGCAWTDAPETSVSALVVAESDPALANEQACRLARAVWDRRGEFGPDVETASVEEAVSRALSAPEKTVFISDSGDNVTAGGAGDLPVLAEALLAARASGAVVAGIADPEAVERCASVGLGKRIRLSIGGKLDRVNGRPFVVDGEVVRVVPSEGLAVFGVEGIEILLSRDRRAFTSLSSFGGTGIEPLERKVVVVKLGYLFPDLRDHAPRAIMALSPGFTDLRLEHLPYQRVRRPIHPLDEVGEWSPEVDLFSSRKAIDRP